MNAPIRIATSLRNAPGAAMTREEMAPLRERAWVEGGMICVYPDEIADAFVRQGLINLATLKFGRRMQR